MRIRPLRFALPLVAALSIGCSQSTPTATPALAGGAPEPVTKRDKKAGQPHALGSTAAQQY